jgi:TatD DNase family protein
MIFDTHAHYTDGRFDADRDALLSSMPAKNVGLIMTLGDNLAESRAAVSLAHRYPFVYAGVGVHPSDIAELDDGKLGELRALAADEKVKCIGEIGLDYYWKDNAPRDVQKAGLRRQMELARELSLPVVIHDREAHGDSMSVVREFPDVRGEFHCYSGAAEDARELVKRGWYLGFGGSATYKNARRALEVIAAVPMDRILVETDCPYLAPEPFRGRRNDSSLVSEVVKKIAEVRGVSASEVEAATYENGKRFFNIND